MSDTVQHPEVHLNLNVRGLSNSATLQINETSNRLLREGKKVYKLGLGQSPFPVPEPVVQALRESAREKDYLPVMGLPELQEAVSDYLRNTEQVEFSPQNIMIGPGSKELMFILQLVYYGDLVIPTPSWVSYAPQAHIIGRHIRWIPTEAANHWRLTPGMIEKLCEKDPSRPRLIILNYPGNPSGYSYTGEELRGIAEVARKYKIVLLSDEIYGQVHHTGEHESIATYYPEGTVISTGLSKWCGAGGWRLGIFAFPDTLKWLRDAMGVVASETFTSTSAPIQYAAIRAFQLGPEIEEYLHRSRRILHSLGSLLAVKLRTAGANLLDPHGGFYLFPDFTSLKGRLAERGITTSDELCNTLLEDTGVATLPGTAFGRPEGELTLRLAYVDFDGEGALDAVGNTEGDDMLSEEFLREYCGNCVEGIEKICSWLRE